MCLSISSKVQVPSDNKPKNLIVNGKPLNAQSIQELDDDVTISEAINATRKNGFDEVFFESDGKNYVAYGDKLNLAQFKKGGIPTATYGGKEATIPFAPEDEKNSVWNGLTSGSLDGLRTTRDIITNGLGTSMKAVAVGGVVATGGAITIAGVALVRGKAMATPLSSLLGDVLVGGATKASKATIIAAGTALGLSVVGGAVYGAIEAMSTEKDISTIAGITKVGKAKKEKPVEAPKPDNTKPADTKIEGQATVQVSDRQLGKPIKVAKLVINK